MVEAANSTSSTLGNVAITPVFDGNIMIKPAKIIYIDYNRQNKILGEFYDIVSTAKSKEERIRLVMNFVKRLVSPYT